MESNQCVILYELCLGMQRGYETQLLLSIHLILFLPSSCVCGGGGGGVCVCMCVQANECHAAWVEVRG